MIKYSITHNHTYVHKYHTSMKYIAFKINHNALYSNVCIEYYIYIIKT